MVVGVILYNRYTQDREEIGQKLAQEEGLTLIPHLTIILTLLPVRYCS